MKDFPTWVLIKWNAVIAGTLIAAWAVLQTGHVYQQEAIPLPLAIIAAGLFVSAAILHASEREDKDDRHQ
jgi:hypothetical protein